MTRQLKREVKIGNITIGGTNPIAVQPMLLSLIHISSAKNCPAVRWHPMWRTSILTWKRKGTSWGTAKRNRAIDLQHSKRSLPVGGLLFLFI